MNIAFVAKGCRMRPDAPKPQLEWCWLIIFWAIETKAMKKEL